MSGAVLVGVATIIIIGGRNPDAYIVGALLGVWGLVILINTARKGMKQWVR